MVHRLSTAVAVAVMRTPEECAAVGVKSILVCLVVEVPDRRMLPVASSRSCQTVRDG